MLDMDMDMTRKGVLTFQYVPLLQLFSGGSLAESSGVGEDDVSITTLRTNLVPETLLCFSI